MIYGINKLSLIDYPGKISAVIFLGGCNLNCPYCHNRPLLDNSFGSGIEISEVIQILKERKNFIDAIVVTGGEPTIYEDKLVKLLKQLKKLNLLIKLDTNGTNPNLIKQIIDLELINYIAMDIKNSFEKYSETANKTVDVGSIKTSINLIKNSGLEYEFRTTILKEFHNMKDLHQILEYVDKPSNLYFQNYKYSKTQTRRFTNFSDCELEKVELDLKVRTR